MFASERARNIFLGSTIVLWILVLLAWIFYIPSWPLYFNLSESYPYLSVAVLLLFFLCYCKPQRKVWRILVPILAEALLVAIPMLSFWTMMMFLHMMVKYETVVSSGQPITSLHLVFFVLAFFPAITFPLLRRWSRTKIQ